MKNQNKLAKQIINQATKTKQILLSTSIKLLTLISVLIISNYLCAMTPSRTDQEKSDRMAKLAKCAEDMYAASSAEKAADKVPTPVITPAPKAATIETAKLESDKSEPKTLDRTNLDNSLDKHGNITDDFWKELSQCKKCPPKRERIDCKTILRDNPAWQKVVPMDHATKKMIMDKVLHDIPLLCEENEDSTCRLICAICAGTDPNQRQDIRGGGHMSPLRLAGNVHLNHFSLAKLLLEKGANPNYGSWLGPGENEVEIEETDCYHPCSHWHLYPTPTSQVLEWLDELAKYGPKCTEVRTEFRARLRDGR